MDQEGEKLCTLHVPTTDMITKVDIFSKDLVLIPCNLGNSHWTCASINIRDKRIEYYDSLGMDRLAIRQVCIFVLLRVASSNR